MTPMPGSLAASFAIVFALLTAVAVLGGGAGGGAGGDAVADRDPGPALADPVPYDGRSPREPAGTAHRVLVALPRPALGDRRDLAALGADERRAYVASLRDESEALRSGLQARGIRLGDVVTYERAWNGFAATVRSRDLARLTAAGIRTRTVRRFYPAVSEPVRVPGSRDEAAAPAAADAPVVALLSSGVPPLPFLAPGGYDAVDRDADPAAESDPRDRDRTETGALGPAAVLGAAGLRVRPLRVSGLRVAPDGTVSEHGTTDELLLGLERAVDPDGDGDPSDGADVAVVGVSAPYAGFSTAPEAAAVTAARRLGTRVVVPAGHEATAVGPYGTIGSPGGAPGAVTVGAGSDPAAVARVALQIDGIREEGAALLAGHRPRGRLETAGPVDADRAEDLAAGSAGLGGRLVVVRAGDNPTARVTAAATAGAAAVLVAQDADDVPLSTLPAGAVAVPVLGVTGEVARGLLEAGAGQEASVGRVRLDARLRPGRPFGGRQSPFSSRGPAFDGAAAPDVVAPSTVLTARRVVSGAAVAAAHVGVRLARGRRVRGATGTPPRAAAAPVGDLRLTQEEGETGVRFVLGAFERGLPTRIVPVERLELRLDRLDGGTAVPARRLTPPGGELGLLPGEYSYTLVAGAVRGLAAGRYRFTARAWAPRAQRPTTRRSAPFDVP